MRAHSSAAVQPSPAMTRSRSPRLCGTSGGIQSAGGSWSSTRIFALTSVFRLRRRIKRDPKQPVLLLTEARIGYRFAPESVDHLNFEARRPQQGNGAGSP
jgi:hypothetical protein